MELRSYHNLPINPLEIKYNKNEYDENVVHNQYRLLLRSGLGFGAQKWISTLQKHCECVATIMSPDASIDDSPVLSQGGRRSLKNLAQRMTANFCAGVCATGGHKWEVIGNAAETAKIMIRKSLNNPGEPAGAVLSATMSVWMPMPHQRLFALMLNEELRSQWDVLSPGSAMQNMIRFSKGQDPGNPNTFSLLRATDAEHEKHGESYFFDSSSFTASPRKSDSPQGNNSFFQKKKSIWV